MKKRVASFLLTFLFALCCAFGLTACNQNSAGTDENSFGTESSGGEENSGREEAEKNAGTEGLSYTLSNTGSYYICSGPGTATETDITVASWYQGKQVTAVGDYAFNSHHTITSITIPEGIISIGSYAFSYCESLTEITIPDSVMFIGSGAFSSCTSLAEITIPDGVTFIGFRAFYDCLSLTEITIPNGVTCINSYTFYGCTSLTDITIPNSVTYIDYQAFENCVSLANITLPDSVTRIEENAFYNTAFYNDENNWEDGVLYIGNHLIRAKDTLSGSYSIKPGTLTIADGAFFYFPNPETDNASFSFIEITDVIIPDSVISIGEMAFYCCFFLENINIPDSVTFIGAETFYNTALYDNESNWQNGVLYIGNHLIRAKDTLSSAYSIKPGTLTIADSAFLGCRALINITIPDSVTFISMYAFRDCSALSSATFKNTRGWKYYDYNSDPRIIDVNIASENLQDPGAAAEFLKETYCAYNWIRG